MIKLIRVHRLHNRDFVHNGCQMRQQFGKFSPRFAVPLKCVRSAQHLGNALDEREALLLEQRFRTILPVQLLQLWLIVEQIQLRRRTGHVQINHPLGFRREVCGLGLQRILMQIGPQKIGEPDQAEARANGAECVAACHMNPYGTKLNSFELSRTCAYCGHGSLP